MQMPLSENQIAALDASGRVSSLSAKPTSEPCETPHPEWVATALRLLAVYSVVRVGLLFSDVLSAHIYYGLTLSGPLLAWDAHWYIQIANHGYPPPIMASGHLTYNAANFLPF